ncbi:hypothetical protein PFNF135_05481 [Plasmodium falciparum NF135/5.C10]|uniref:Uncharacterized protein n=1 Tax=Plasmodium falciparum NF135/5.C10 TaxID=1036726 RepID=W4I8Y1_PLAFA|nr:hypothetical protein PFNF135_05481 [Plasmodium falciparum NF135/5.C10]
MLNGIIEKFYFIKTYIYILLCSFKVKKNKSLYTKDSEYFETEICKIVNNCTQIHTFELLLSRSLYKIRDFSFKSLDLKYFQLLILIYYK